MQIAFCIAHQHSVLVQQSLVGECHEYSVYYDGQLELDWCNFPCGWAMMEEPEYDSDWELNLVEPYEEEKMINWDEFNQAVQNGVELELMAEGDDFSDIYPRWMSD